MNIKIPYQNHVNKRIFDYILSCCNQQNNVNFAKNLTDLEAKENNYVYLCIFKTKIYFFLSISNKNNVDNTYNSLFDIIAELKDVNFFDTADNIKIYKFDIKKLYSTLSFSSDYKDRDNITLIFSDDLDMLCYKISETIFVDIAHIVTNSELNSRICNKFLEDICTKKTDVCISKIGNVDKNSFLLPYFNHKDCLNFTVAFTDNLSVIHKFQSNLYITNTYYDKEDNKLKYQSTTLLREDKFRDLYNVVKENGCLKVSPGFWQLLVMLQNNKQWRTLDVFDDYIDLNFDDNKDCVIKHFFSSSINNIDCFNSYSFNLEEFKLVGKMCATEIFLLNKLFSNSKNSYFDFSLQKFIGDNYVFSDNSDNKSKSIVDLNYNCDSELPLCISFTELKHYIGGDLSQKNFMLYVYTDGINVMLEKYNNEETLLENRIIFNHDMSKSYLNL